LDQPQSGIIRKALKKTPLYRFFIFIFGFEYLKRLQNSELLHTKMHLTLLLVGITGCMGKTVIFSAELCPKMRESQHLFLGLWLVRRKVYEETQQSAIQTKIEQHFGGFI
jgi:hypothetical protein